LRAEEETHRLAEEARVRAEEEGLLRAEAEARLREEQARIKEEEQARLKAEEEANRLAHDAWLRAEEQAQRRADAEARMRDEQARLRAEEEALLRAEEALRLAEEARVRAEDEARRIGDEEAQIRLSQEIDAFEIVKTEETLASAVNEEISWVEVEVNQSATETIVVEDSISEPVVVPTGELSGQPSEPVKTLDVKQAEKGIAQAEDDSGIPAELLRKLSSEEPHERAGALSDIAQIGGEDAFPCISRTFDDPSIDVRNAAARALYSLQVDRAASFTRALREGSPERRRRIGAALAGSGLASDAISNLTGESREKTYDAFSLLFLMAKAGEVHPLMRAVEEHPNIEVRLAVVKLLALSGQADIVPAFRRLAVRGSLPSEVRSAVMEAIYQISSQARETTPSAA